MCTDRQARGLVSGVWDPARLALGGCVAPTLPRHCICCRVLHAVRCSLHAVRCHAVPRAAHRAPLGPPGAAALHNGQLEGGSRGRLDGCLDGVGVICSRQRQETHPHPFDSQSLWAACLRQRFSSTPTPPHPTPPHPPHTLLRTTAAVPAMPSPLAPRSFTLNLAG